MKQSLQLKTSQQLKLTPQLQQSLRLLQLTSAELAIEVQLELDQNPLLEEADSHDQDANSDNTSSQEHAAETEDSRADLDFNTEQVQPSSDTDWDEVFESRRVNVEEAAYAGDGGFNDNIAGAEASLYTHLYWQISMTNLSERDLLIAQSLLHNLNDDGYLMISPAQLVTSFEPSLEIEEDEIAAVLSLIKSLEPIGVGAANISERLAMILGHQYPEHPAYPLAREIVCFHLETLAGKNLAQLKAKLNVGDAELTLAVRLITSISPRITSNFGSTSEYQVTPDIIVKKRNEQWVASINALNQHRLKLNTQYQDLLSTKLDDDSSEFIRTKLQAAKVFIKSLMSRYDTLQLVAQQIVSRQQAFFEHGQLHMAAMTLADIATELDLHESTISRATAGKYLQSPAGVFELKYFFSSGLQSANKGESVSSTVIRTLIKQFIDREDKLKPLSDSKLEALLKEQGHQVARRTVAKYRESLEILPSNQRKQF